MQEFLHTGLVSNWMGNNRLQDYSQWDAGISTHRLSIKLDGQQPTTAIQSEPVGMLQFPHTGKVSNWMGNNRLQQYSQWDAGILHTGLVSNWMGNNRLQHYSQWDAGISTHRLSLKLDGQQQTTAIQPEPVG